MHPRATDPEMPGAGVVHIMIAFSTSSITFPAHLRATDPEMPGAGVVHIMIAFLGFI